MTRSQKSKGMAKRVTALLVALVIACLSLASCSDAVTDPVMEHEGQEISLPMYEFMLSRMKGTLARNKYDVAPLSTFWSELRHGTDMTNEEYYNKTILDNCKNYLAALILFEREGLSLPESVTEGIEEELAFYVDYDGQGEEEKLDAILSKYGVNCEELRRIYTVEAKYQYLIAYLYGSDASLIADTVKTEFYEDNYYRFKQILVADFYYEYQKDGQGNVIYFDPESSKPIYDESGVYLYDEDGNRVKDSYGVTVRYDLEGNILYDTEKGYPSATLDENGEAIKHYYTEEQMSERVKSMQELIDSVSDGNYAAFESKIPEWSLFESPDEYYPDGYYLSDIESAGYEDYMLDILAKIKEMDVGETDTVESEYGYHVIMKYPLDEGKYSDSEYAEWFKSFNSSLINKLFLDKCDDFYGEITVNDKNLAKARSIKSIGANFDY